MRRLLDYSAGLNRHTDLTIDDGKNRCTHHYVVNWVLRVTGCHLAGLKSMINKNE